MSKKLIIPVDVFDIDVEVYISDDVSEVCEQLDKENNDKNQRLEDLISGFEEAFSVYCNQYKAGMIYKRIVIIINEDCSEEALTHECLHTAWNILYHKHIGVQWEDHEALAYLQGYLNKKIKYKLLKL